MKFSLLKVFSFWTDIVVEQVHKYKTEQQQKILLLVIDDDKTYNKLHLGISIWFGD